MSNHNKMFFNETDTPDQIVAKIEEIVADDNQVATDELLTLLNSTQDAGVRNTTAIALADWKEQQAVPILLHLLQSDTTVKSRGTLIYALQAYDCEPFLPQIAQQVCFGNLEVKENAVQIFIDLPDELSQKAIEQSLQVLRSCTNKDEYVIHAIEIMEEIAENNKP